MADFWLPDGTHVDSSAKRVLLVGQNGEIVGVVGGRLKVDAELSVDNVTVSNVGINSVDGETMENNGQYMPVKQTGSMVEEIVMVHGDGGITHTHLQDTTIRFYPGYSGRGGIASTTYGVRWINGSKYKEKLIVARNTYDVQVKLTLYDQTRDWYGEKIFEIDIPAGAEAVITQLDQPKLALPFYNLIFVSQVQTLATSGTLMMRFRGRV